MFVFTLIITLNILQILVAALKFFLGSDEDEEENESDSDDDDTDIHVCTLVYV